jgi:hypothetical protein
MQACDQGTGWRPYQLAAPLFEDWLAAQPTPPADPLLEYYSWLARQPSPHKGEAARRWDVLEMLRARRGLA